MLARRYRRRIAALEASLPTGCSACRERRGRIVLFEPHKGDVEPAPCPECRVIPEFIIAVIRPDDVATFPVEP